MNKGTREAAKWIGVMAGVLVMIVSGVWNVATISASNETLTGSIERLDDTLQRIDLKLTDHNMRISRLEGQAKL